VRGSVGHQFVTIATNATRPRQVKAAVCFKLRWFVCDSVFFCFALHWPLLLLFLYVSLVILQCTCFVAVWAFYSRCEAKRFAVFRNLLGFSIYSEDLIWKTLFLQCVNKHSKPLPVNKHSKPLPVNKHSKPLPVNKHSKPLPVNKHSKTLPVNKHSKPLPVNLFFISG